MSCQRCCVDLLQAEPLQSAPCLPKQQGGHCCTLWGKGQNSRSPSPQITELATFVPRHFIAWHYKICGTSQSQICKPGCSLPSSHCTALLPSKRGPLHSQRNNFTPQLGHFIHSWWDRVLTCYGLTIWMNRNRYSLQKDVYDFVTEWQWINGVDQANVGYSF